MTLHLSQIFFTDALTFITAPDLSVLLVAVYDPAPGQIVRTELYRHPVAREDADEILSHASRYVRQNLVLVFKLDFEHRVGQRLYDSCHYFNRVFLRQTLFPILPAMTIPLASLPYCVKITAPSAVTATVCSK